MSKVTIDRRAALGLIASGAAAALPATGAQAAPKGGVRFAHGVASGDPGLTGAVLWTRVTTEGTAPVDVSWHVAESAGAKPIESGTMQARPARDFTVKVEPKTLKAGQDYVYWFEAAGVKSPVGRFRTLPEGKLDQLVFAVTNCQLFGNGLFNAYETIAQEPTLDAVLFLGDYIYEYEALDYGGANARKLNRIVEPAHEIVTLADYRLRHASYKSDTDLQAAHARAAWICVWDDHETADNSWVHGAVNHQPATEGDWDKRKAAAMQAYFEWMPIRDPIPGQPWEAINRDFQFGDLATLLMVETRLLARSQQADEVSKPTDAASIKAALVERDRPEREMLGQTQRAWLEREMKASVASGKPWQVLGNQVVMARVPGPAVSKEMIDMLPAPIAQQVRVADAGFRAGLPYNLDSWDGYPAARERLYASFRAAGSHPIVLSGDSHAFWANDLFDDKGTLVAAEFGVSSITSPSVGDSLPGVPLGPMLEKAGEEVVFCDQSAKGYIRLTLTRAAAQADYVAVPILAKPYKAERIARYETKADGVRLKRIS